MSSNNLVSEQGNNSVAIRGQKVATSFSFYARQFSFANTTRRNLYKVAGLAPRIRDRFFAVLIILSTVMCFVLPVVGGSIYFLFIQSEQYQSEVRFVLRSATPLLTGDRFGDSGFEPKAKIIQDTQIVVNYINSDEFVRVLGEQHDINQVFGSENIDWLSRLQSDWTIEDLVDYWDGQHKASIHPKSGIVTLKINAFTPEEAHNILQTSLSILEARINSMNEGIWSTLIGAASNELESASNKVSEARLKLQKTQNALGVLNVELTGRRISENLRLVESEIATLKAQKLSLEKFLSPDASSMKLLDQRIAGLELQAKKLRGLIAGEKQADGPNLAEASSLLTQRELEMEIANDRFGEAIATIERVKYISSLQHMFLDRFAAPTKPEESSGLAVWLKVFLLLLACSAIWGSVTGVLVLIRDKID